MKSENCHVPIAIRTLTSLMEAVRMSSPLLLIPKYLPAYLSYFLSLTRHLLYSTGPWDTNWNVCWQKKKRWGYIILNRDLPSLTLCLQRYLQEMSLSSPPLDPTSTPAASACCLWITKRWQTRHASPFLSPSTPHTHLSSIFLSSVFSTLSSFLYTWS